MILNRRNDTSVFVCRLVQRNRHERSRVRLHIQVCFNSIRELGWPLLPRDFSTTTAIPKSRSQIMSQLEIRRRDHSTQLDAQLEIFKLTLHRT